jgi:hypothetical protein
MSNINIKQIKNIAKKSEKIGNKAYKKFDKSNQIESGKLAVSAFKNVLYANSLLIRNKKI